MAQDYYTTEYVHQGNEVIHVTASKKEAERMRSSLKKYGVEYTTKKREGIEGMKIGATKQRGLRIMELV